MDVPDLAAGRRTRRSFVRPVVAPGWRPPSRWGYDAALECYWADLWPADGGPPVVVDPEHLIGSVAALAGAVALLRGGDRGTAWCDLVA